jgi:hypothetical protein
MAAAGCPADKRDGLAHQEFRAAAGYEDSGIHGQPQAAELRPPDHVFDGLAGSSPFHHRGKVVGCPCGRDEQPRLLLGEDTAGGPQPGDDGGTYASRRGHVWTPHPSVSPGRRSPRAP